MMLQSRKLRIFLLILLLAATVLLATGWLDNWVETVQLNPLHRSNQAYLDSALNRSLVTFGVLSGLKVGLAIIEGSEIGVGFGIEVGDAVQSVYDYVDLAWRLVLGSGLVLLGTQYLLLAAGLVDHWLLALLLILIIIKLLKLRTPWLKPLFRTTLLLNFAFWLILPLSIWGGRQLSSAITRPAIENAQEEVAQFQKTHFPTEKASFGSAWAVSKETVKQTVALISGKASDMIRWVLQLMAGYLFDTLVFPLALFFLMSWCVKSVGRHYFTGL